MKKTDTYRLIKNTARKIGKKFHPKKIILFGSHANDRASLKSDVDLLIIFPNNEKRSQYTDISKEFEPRPFPVDLLIRTTKQINDRLKIGDSFIYEIIHKGKVLYES